MAASDVRHPSDPARRIRAVLFDLDGTLYRQAPLRRLMAMELLTLPLSGPLKAPKRLRALRAYRNAQEQLRHGSRNGTVVHAQTALAAQASGLPEAEVAALVDEWMQRRPLKYLGWCRMSGTDALLNWLRDRGVPAGVLSDYPAAAKLEAMGLADRFEFVLSAADPEIGRFKPDPRGFARACERWGLPPREVLMVGDRLAVDGAGAAAAGMPSVILGGRPPDGAAVPRECVFVASMEELRRVLDDRR
jgi:HAD superfamily hydrolase (TIGR01509 family)